MSSEGHPKTSGKQPKPLESPSIFKVHTRLLVLQKSFGKALEKIKDSVVKNTGCSIKSFCQFKSFSKM